MNKVKMAYELFESDDHRGGSWAGGFNQRVLGDLDIHGRQYWDFGPRYAGFQHAQKMIDDGKIYYRHIFPHDCSGTSFSYGGTQVCNTCGQSRLDKPWWNIRITKDGNAFMVAGEGFEDLQASDNYAFGDTKDEALANYQKLMESAS